ncbi:MAG TPA: glucoamylase, partial [Actinoplanes sp.]|nr:glucoamylase [Actinoplanes sp.]
MSSIEVGTSRFRLLSATVAAVLVALVPAAPAAAQPEPPGAPGAAATWTTGDKDGVGTAVSRDSKVWYTLTGGTLSETYYPAADTPNVRELSFVVSDGASTRRETDAGIERVVQLADTRSLSYRQIATDPGRWQLTKTYVTDPARSSVVIDLDFTVLAGGPYQLYAVFDPSLAGTAAQ